MYIHVEILIVKYLQQHQWQLAYLPESYEKLSLELPLLVLEVALERH
jgi:hypothetical protein